MTPPAMIPAFLAGNPPEVLRDLFLCFGEFAFVSSETSSKSSSVKIMSSVCGLFAFFSDFFFHLLLPFSFQPVSSPHYITLFLNCTEKT